MNDQEIVIDKKIIKEYALALYTNEQIEREMTDEELTDAFWRIHDSIFEVINDKLMSSFEMSEILRLNKNSQLKFPHYRVEWRNENAYHPVFETRMHFGNLVHAKQYIHDDFITEFDEWRVYLVSKGTEKLVYQVN
jgi:hypothetical protein